MGLTTTSSPTSTLAAQISSYLGDVTPVQVELVMRGIKSPARDIDLAEFNSQAVKALLMAMEFYSDCYIAPDSGAEMFKEMIAFWRKRYGQISVEELWEAFSLAAAGIFAIDLDVKKFNVKHLSKLLKAYAEWRLRVVVKINEAAERLQRDEREDRRREQNEAARRDVCDQFAALREFNDRVAHWAEVKAWTVDILRTSGVLPDLPIERKREILKAAHDEAVAELQRGILGGNNATAIRAVLDQVRQNPANLPNDFKAKRDRIYGQMVVFEHIAPCAKNA